MNYLFQEKQRINILWVKCLIALTGIAFGYELITKIQAGTALIHDFFPVAIVAFIYASIFLSVLETKIDTKGIYVRYFPFQPFFRFIAWEDVNKCYMLQYDPRREYNGRGYTKGRFGRAYTIAGNMGFQLIIGKKNEDLLIGTQKPEELRKLMRELSENGLIGNKFKDYP